MKKSCSLWLCGTSVPLCEPPGALKTSRSRITLNVAERDRLPQAGQRIAGRDELLTDIPRVPDVEQRAHDGRVLELLGVVQLAAAGDASGVYVTNDVGSQLVNARDHI